MKTFARFLPFFSNIKVLFCVTENLGNMLIGVKGTEWGGASNPKKNHINSHYFAS